MALPSRGIPDDQSTPPIPRRSRRNGAVAPQPPVPPLCVIGAIQAGERETRRRGDGRAIAPAALAQDRRYPDFITLSDLIISLPVKVASQSLNSPGCARRRFLHSILTGGRTTNNVLSPSHDAACGRHADLAGQRL